MPYYPSASADPLAIVTAPPPDETDEERATREAEEAEAKRISDLIDEDLKEEKAALKKEKQSLVKVLLLGQSESGKSTTLKSALFNKLMT
jgi:polynucleotide 5'-kinase involved in rRNA processing